LRNGNKQADVAAIRDDSGHFLAEGLHRSASLRNSRQCHSQALNEGESLGKSGEERLFGFECGGVDAAAESAHPDGVLEVEHLVIEQVLDGVPGTGRPVEDAADDDGVVGGIVMTQ
jgi:hypothetical protein